MPANPHRQGGVSFAINGWEIRSRSQASRTVFKFVLRGSTRVPQSFAVGETPPNKSPPHSAAGSLRTGDARASTEPPPLPADAGKSRPARIARFPCLLPPRTFLRIVDLAGVVCPAQFATQRVAIWEGLIDVPHIAEIGRIQPFAKLRRGPPRNRCAAVAPRVTVTSERQSKSMPSNVGAKLRVAV